MKAIKQIMGLMYWVDRVKLVLKQTKKKIIKEIMKAGWQTHRMKPIQHLHRTAPYRTHTYRHRANMHQKQKDITLSSNKWQASAFVLPFSKNWGYVSEICLFFFWGIIWLLTGCYHYYLTAHSEKTKTILFVFPDNRNGEREQPLILPYLSCHSKTKAPCPINSCCLLTPARISGDFHGNIKDWVQVTHSYWPYSTI